MLTPNEARKVADEVNEERKKSLFNLYQKVWEKHKKYIEESIEERAKLGEYRCMSENLYVSEHLTMVKYDPEHLEEFLKDKIKKIFGEAYGYKIIDDGSNYLTISWEEEDLA